MTIEIALLISGVSLAAALYFGIANAKRNQKADVKTDTAELTTVIVKLENIGAGVAKIENKLSNIEGDTKENRERIIKVEEAIKRIDAANNQKVV